MATIVLQAVGAAVGGFVGGPVGAVVGRALGAVGGAYVDQQLFGSGDSKSVGPRMENAQVLSSREGAAIPRVFGRARISGEIIWATRFEEVQTTETQTQGGKGGSSGKQTTTTTTYSYFANFAVGLCEGEVFHFGRIWADGKLLDQLRFSIRRYHGGETQQPDSLIDTKQGAGNTPAYRGHSYVVFERLPLEDFGNRIPQIAVEVTRPLGDLEQKLFAVNMIPGATEFGYDPNPVIEQSSNIRSVPLNTHQTVADTDFAASFNELRSLCPNLKQIALVVAWFGDDLRADHCQITPRVEVSSRNIQLGDNWVVAGRSRGAVSLVSYYQGNPAYGGTPSDVSVIRAIQIIRAHGIKVCLNPFVMMDIPQTNGLPDPYGESQQAAYPWRGRITCDPAPQLPGSPDGTITARQQVEAFVGSAQPDQFTQTSNGVSHSGISDWGYRRMVLHYAHLAEVAGGVDLMLIGSEMRGLTQVRGEGESFPFVEALKDLADDVAGIVRSGCEITYGADWSEFFGYQPADGSGDVYFHLDPLWASASIDAVGIDNYMPLSDWRSTGSPDAVGRSASDPDMLAAQIAAGEGFDWYYANDADRTFGIRTEITDDLGKPWVFRYKDLTSCWQNQHFDRRAGSEVATPSDWAAESKPILFTELGCPAVNNGAGQPNVFVDPKSSESHLPYHSNGGRNDQMQAAYIEAQQRHWMIEEGENPNNPISSVYHQPMVDFERAQFWAWDARPYPTFPSETNLWSDAPNWQLGHWLNGRLGMVRLADLITELLTSSGVADFDVTQVSGMFDGYLLAQTSSARQALEVRISLFRLSVFEDAGTIFFLSPGRDPVTVLSTNDLLHVPAEASISYVTEQESDLPVSVQLAHIDPHIDFQNSQTTAWRNSRSNPRQHTLSAPIIIGRECATPLLEAWLHERWTGRDVVSFGLSRAFSHLTIGDVVAFSGDDLAPTWRITRIESGEAMQVTAQAVELGEIESSAVWSGEARITASYDFGKPLSLFMDLPYLPHLDGNGGNCLAVAANPWPGEIAVYASPGSDGFSYQQPVSNAAYIGELESELPATSVFGRWEEASRPRIVFHDGTIASLAPELVLNGGNALAVMSRSGLYEILQFERAELVGEQTYELSHLLRGQAGTEVEAGQGADIGASVVILNQAVTNLVAEESLRGLETNWLSGPAGLALDGPEFSQTIFTPGYRKLIPYSPVHLKAVADPTGKVVITWVRRDRINSDDWSAIEIPMSEASESYRVTVNANLPGSIDQTVSEPNLSISHGELLATFGAMPSHLDISVAQVSATIGDGPAAGCSINL